MSPAATASHAGAAHASGPTAGRVALAGAGIGVALAFAYALCFILSAVLVTSLRIASQAAPDAGRIGTLVASGAALAIASLSITCLLALLAACGGAVTALLVRSLDTAFNRERSTARAGLLGAAAALAVALPYQLLVLRPMRAMDIYLPLATYLFWFGLPALLHVAAGALGSRRLNSLLAAAEARPAAAAPQPA